MTVDRVEIDLSKVRMLAESAERRAQHLHSQHDRIAPLADTPPKKASVASLLNDFFYWSGKATSYRGIIAMAELQTIVEDELDAEARCP